MEKINTFFLRISARCNLYCDYCYVFKHRDMSWRNYPKTMSREIIQIFAKRLREYLLKYNNTEINIIFHGGEPLIVGESNLIEFSEIIINKVNDIAKVSFSLQTNGTLITESLLNACERKNIGISLSIDGPEYVHNKHRKFLSGSGSFSSVIKGIELLKKHPRIFEGVIGVIDPTNSPDEILEFFDNCHLERIDLLLPDSTYLDPPIGRNQNPDLYKNWLLAVFNSWFNCHQGLRFRTFEYILSGLLGVRTELDAFGLGKLDYLTIETDGSYHTSDILKITYENASNMNISVLDSNIEEAIENKKVNEYNELLKWDNLPLKCKECQFSYVCGGGSLPHRYSPENGFNNPTVYCNEMFALIQYAKEMIEEAIQKEENYEG